MPFDMPTADRARLNELLNVLGDRAEDFRKCFDTESEWCWKYADLMLRGMQQRELEYAEGHHVVPACFYGKRNSTVNEGNLTILTYGEHLYAHYCAALCGIGKMKGKMATAFLLMYNVGIKNTKPILPEEQEFIESIPEREVRRILFMDPQVSRVEAEGRTHYWEGLKQYKKDYYEANKEKHNKQMKDYYEANKERLSEQYKSYREANKEKIAVYKKEYREKNRLKLVETEKLWREKNKEHKAECDRIYREKNRLKLAEQKKVYREVHKERIAEQKKRWYESNKERVLEHAKTHWEANKERISKQRKVWYEANKETILANQKKYREANKEIIAERKRVYSKANSKKIVAKVKAWYEAKKAAGYRYRKDPATGKYRWVFVGLPGTPESLCA